MGNANGRDGEVGGDDLTGRSNGDIESIIRDDDDDNNSSSMVNTPPQSPGRSRSPLMFAPQVPVIPLQRVDGPSALNHMWHDESHLTADQPSEQGVPTMITWSYGGHDVAVEGSWDGWKSRRKMQRSGKDHFILLVLPSGIFHYKFIVDGEWRYIPELPTAADDGSGVYNVLDVHEYVPENPESIAEFEAPPSPDSSYSQTFPPEEDFAKEPVAVPPQLHDTVLGMENEASPKPQHAVLNHLYIEKGWASQSVVALGMTHRIQSKYVTLVLYKPLIR